MLVILLRHLGVCNNIRTNLFRLWEKTKTFISFLVLAKTEQTMMKQLVGWWDAEQTIKQKKLIRYHPQKNKNNRSDKNDFVCENDLHILKWQLLRHVLITEPHELISHSEMLLCFVWLKRGIKLSKYPTTFCLWDIRTL